MSEILLSGCQPEPLAGYLKALAVLRLVSAQKDSKARGHWSAAGFVLTTDLTTDDLCTYFLDEYQPTPIVSPWNGGSGFGPKDNTEGLNAITSSSSSRLASYQQVIESVRSLARMGDGEGKDHYLTRLRNILPEAALPWLDAAVVIAEDGARFPILLGTGGNDGRLDFSNNFMQRLADALRLLPTKKRSVDPSPSWLRAALFGDGQVGLVDAAIGQFDPGGAGGSNSAPQGKGKSLVNPWDFVLMIEGSVVFAGAAVRRRPDERQAVSVPFSFLATNAGYSSAAIENGRGELWSPLWSEPATMASVQSLFSEGRITWNGRGARDGLEAVRAVATLQLDRRIDQFVRYSIAERFGLSNVAVPVGRIVVPEAERGDVLLTATFDPWLNAIRRLGEKGIPGSISTALRNVDAALVEQARSPLRNGRAMRLFEVLDRVAALERAIALSRNVRERVRPIRGLKAGRWREHLQGLLDDSAESRLAWSLASGRDAPSRTEATVPSLRVLLLPVAFERGIPRWSEGVMVDGIESAPVDDLLAQVAARRQWLSPSRREGHETVGVRLCNERGARASVADVAAFARGEIDRLALARFLRAFLVLDFNGESGLARTAASTGRTSLDALTAAVLAHAGPSDAARPVPPGLVAQLAANSDAAMQSLRRALRIAGAEPQLPDSTGGRGKWLAAALLFNLGNAATRCLALAGYRETDPIVATDGVGATAVLDEVDRAVTDAPDEYPDEVATPGADAPTAGG